jgi:hypothetical protein
MIKKDKTDEINRDERVENRDESDDENERAWEKNMKIWEKSFLKPLFRTINFGIFEMNETIRWVIWSDMRCFCDEVDDENSDLWNLRRRWNKNLRCENFKIANRVLQV